MKGLLKALYARTAVTELPVSAGTHFPWGEVYRQEQELAGVEPESEALRGPVWFYKDLSTCIYRFADTYLLTPHFPV